MSHDHETSELSLENLMETAEAMAIRDGEFSEVLERLTASLSGTEYQPTPEHVRSERTLGKTALNLLRIENPDTVVSIKDFLAATERREDTQAIVDQINAVTDDEEFRVDAEHVRNMKVAMVSGINDAMGFDEARLTKEFLKSHEAARQVAQENGVSLAEVFRDDSLYYESRRRTETAEEFAADAKKAFDQLSAHTLQSAMVRVIEQILPKNILEEMDSEEITEMMTDMQLDPEFTKALEASLETPKEAMRQALMYRFLKIYGYGELSKLEPDTLDAFMPRLPWVKEVFEDMMS